MQRNYKIELDVPNNKVRLLDQNQVLLTANYRQDSADGATLISGFEYSDKADQTQCLAKLMADKLRANLALGSVNVKLFIYPGQYAEEFVQSEDFAANTYKSKIDRLMVRPRDTSHVARPLPENIERLTLENASEVDKAQLLLLLKEHTYWGKDVQAHYVKCALRDSTVFVMREAGKIIGFCRYMTNNQIAYISDMVVHADYRKNGRGKLILKTVIADIDKNCESSCLIHAGSGPGLDASDNLYRKNGGYVMHDGNHKVVFSYIKVAPTLTNLPAASFAQASNNAQPVVDAPKPRFI